MNTARNYIRPIKRELVALVVRALPVRVLGSLDVVRLGDVLVYGALAEDRALLGLGNCECHVVSDSLHSTCETV